MQMLTVTMIGSVGFLESNATAPADLNSAAAVPPDPKPVFIPPGAGEKGKIAASDVVFKLDKSQTAGNLGSSELILPPGNLGAPPHFHKAFDEVCIVLEGAVHIMVGQEVVEVQQGGWHLRPRGITHTFWNSGDKPAKLIELYSPGGHDAYMKDLARLFEGGARPKPAELSKLAELHDIIFEFGKLQAILDKYKVHL